MHLHNLEIVCALICAVLLGLFSIAFVVAAALLPANREDDQDAWQHGSGTGQDATD